MVRGSGSDLQTVGELVKQSGSTDELWRLGSCRGTERIPSYSLTGHDRSCE